MNQSSQMIMKSHEMDSPMEHSSAHELTLTQLQEVCLIWKYFVVTVKSEMILFLFLKVFNLSC